MSNELERVADAIESARLPSGGTILASRVQIEVLARAAIAAMTPTQVVDPGEQLLRDIFEAPAPDVGVLAEVRAVAKQYADGSAYYGGAINAGMLEILALIDREATQ